MVKSSSTQEIISIIEDLTLIERQKSFVRIRWLEQLNWLKAKAKESRDRFYFLRLTTIVGSSIVPGLVSFKFDTAAFGVSLLVAISAAIEELFHYGDNHRRYRNTAERLKYEGWQFFQLEGKYKSDESSYHTAVFPLFVASVESILRQELEEYTELIKTKNS
jgi:hypothetical protein